MEEIERLLVWMVMRAGTRVLHETFSNQKRTGLDVWQALKLKEAMSRANNMQFGRYGYITPVWSTVVTVEDGQVKVQSAIGNVLA